MAKTIKLKIGENRYCSNEQYHADREYQSSSSLKLLLKNKKKYHEKYKLNKGINRKNSQLEFGTLVHSLLLEPHSIKQQYAFYSGPRIGKKFESFKKKNKGKQILLLTTKLAAEKLVRRIRKKKRLNRILSGGKTEVTACQIIEGVKCKARFDLIKVKRGLILDIKTTRHPRSKLTIFKKDAELFGYWFSAALYIAIAQKTFPPKKFDFFILALCQSDGSHHFHSTRFSEKEIFIKAQVELKKALAKYKKYYGK